MISCKASYPDLVSYIELKYGGEDEPFSPPPDKELKVTCELFLTTWMLFHN